MDHVAEPLHILLAETEGRISFNIICLKLYQLEKITWWCLSVLEFILKSTLQFVMKPVLLEKLLKKSQSPGIYVGLHVDFFIYGVFFEPLCLHLCV